MPAAPKTKIVLSNGVTIEKKSNGNLVFRRIVVDDKVIYSTVKAHVWWEAWEKLKVIDADKSVRWHYIDKEAKSILFVESCLEVEKAIHTVKLYFNLQPLAYSDEFNKIEKLTEKA